MARGRMISRSLGESDKFAELDTHAQRMLYMLLVTHADCEGRLKGNLRWIAGKVLTYIDYPDAEVEAALHRMYAVGLIRLYTVDGKRFIQVEKFHEHNTVRRGKDGTPTHESPSDIPPPSQGSDVATTEELRSSDVAATAEVEVEVEVEVQDEVQVKEEPSSPTGDDLATIPVRHELELLLDAWNENRGSLPAAQKLTSNRRSKLKTLIRDLGGFDQAYSAIAIGAAEVSKDDFWIRRGYGFDNLLAGQKVIQKAETAFNRGTFDREQAEVDRMLAALGPN